MQKEEITKLIIERTKTFGPDNPQQIKQLAFVLSKSDPCEVFYGLYMIFLSEPSQAFGQQELAGKLLFMLQPKPKLNLELAPLIQGALENWNVSIEEFPFYFRDVFGVELVSSAIKSINTSELNELQKNGLKTMKWWLRLS